MKVKRLLAILVLVLALLPAADAALPDVYLSQLSATYAVKEHYAAVDEYLTFTNKGGPYKTALELERGDAWGVEVEGAEFEVLREEGTTVIVLKPSLTLKSETIALHYSRADMIGGKGVVKVFNGSVVEGYPWYIFNITVRFSLPQNYQSDLIFPKEIPGYLEIVKSTALEGETLDYNVRYLLPNKTLPLRFEYANYESLSTEKISVAKTLIEEARYDIKRAGAAIEGANALGVDVKPLILSYNRSVVYLEASESYLGTAEKEFALGKVDPARFKPAYANATEAEGSARASEKSALAALDGANSEVQRLLKGRVSEFNENLSKLEANLTSLEATLALKSATLDEKLAQESKRIDEVMEIAVVQRAAQRVTLGMLLTVVAALAFYFVLRNRLQRSVRWLTFKERHAGAINESVVLILFFVAGVFVMNAAFAEPLSGVRALASDPQAANERMVKVGGGLREADLDLGGYIDFGAETATYLLEAKDGEVYVVYPGSTGLDRRVIVTGIFFSTRVQFKDIPETKLPVEAFIYATDVKASHFWNEGGLSDSAFYMILTYVVAALLAGAYDFHGRYVRKEEAVQKEGRFSRLLRIPQKLLGRIKGGAPGKTEEVAPEPAERGSEETQVPPVVEEPPTKSGKKGKKK